MIEKVELTLEQVIESPWFRGIARGMMILTGLAGTTLGGYIAWAVNDTKTATQLNAGHIQSLQFSMSAYAQGDQERKSEEKAFRDKLDVELGVMRSTLVDLQTNVARINGSLSEIQYYQKHSDASLRIPEASIIGRIP